ncbi:collagen alpha-1(I) chain-like isoform X1 [Lepisosteus oculatus]|uniref:collagen alpha-1(I) chain-like isoform X1 n=1 Tax=Lepisosteus oculatus TaxID=7918 RepID=UPI003723CE9A
MTSEEGEPGHETPLCRDPGAPCAAASPDLKRVKLERDASPAPSSGRLSADYDHSVGRLVVVKEDPFAPDPSVSAGNQKHSRVWEVFTLFANNKLMCSLCGTVLSYHKNTSGMVRHLRVKHAEQYDAAPDGDGAARPAPGDPARAARKRTLDEALLDVITGDCQPFSLVEDEGFRNFVTLLDPRYALPSRKTLKSMAAGRYALHRDRVMAEPPDVRPRLRGPGRRAGCLGSPREGHRRRHGRRRGGAGGGPAPGPPPPALFRPRPRLAGGRRPAARARAGRRPGQGEGHRGPLPGLSRRPGEAGPDPGAAGRAAAQAAEGGGGQVGQHLRDAAGPAGAEGGRRGRAGRPARGRGPADGPRVRPGGAVPGRPGALPHGGRRAGLGAPRRRLQGHPAHQDAAARPGAAAPARQPPRGRRAAGGAGGRRAEPGGGGRAGPPAGRQHPAGPPLQGPGLRELRQRPGGRAAPGGRVLLAGGRPPAGPGPPRRRRRGPQPVGGVRLQGAGDAEGARQRRRRGRRGDAALRRRRLPRPRGRPARLLGRQLRQVPRPGPPGLQVPRPAGGGRAGPPGLLQVRGCPAGAEEPAEERRRAAGVVPEPQRLGRRAPPLASGRSGCILRQRGRLLKTHVPNFCFPELSYVSCLFFAVSFPGYSSGGEWCSIPLCSCGLLMWDLGAHSVGSLHILLGSGEGGSVPEEL